MSQRHLREPLDYRTVRGIQISVVFTFTLFIQEFLRYPRAGWTGFAVMMIYAGFDNGTTLARAYHRFLGVLLGLLSGYFLWFLGHLDYRTLIIIIPMTVYLAYFLVGRAYSVPTVFTVNTSIIGTGYFNPSSATFSITAFLIDYFMCTVIAFMIILIFEYFEFRRYNMMHRFIRDTQKEVVTNLNRLVNLLNNRKIRRSEWFAGCIKLTGSIATVNTLVQNSQFLISAERAVGDEFEQFRDLINNIFVGQKALYFAHYTKRHQKYDYQQLLNQVQSDLDRLKTIVADGIIPNSILGAMHEAHH